LTLHYKVQVAEEIEKADDEKSLTEKSLEPIKDCEFFDFVDDVNERKNHHSNQEECVFGSVSVRSRLKLHEKHLYRDDRDEYARSDY
jgi:hypothetical protein